jgi:glycosyltransferase involved in cell wall biosynthesis/cytochrome c-type biogenesis protein CcmH/NrfG
MLAYLPHHKDVSWPKLAVDDVRHALRRAFAMPNDERRAMGQAAYDYLRADLRPEVLLPQAEELIKSAWAKKVAQEPFLPALVPALKTWLTPETEPVDLPAWLARIESAQAEERWADGVTLAKNALKHGAGHPASAQAGLWNRLGFCHFHLNHRPEAEIAFNRAVELAPTDLAGLTNLAGFYYQQERFDRATEFINRALQVNPQDIDTLMLLGNCALNLGDVDTARLAFGRVQTLAPTTEGIDELVQALAAAEPASDPDPAPEPPTAPAPLRPAPGASAGFSSRPAAGRLPQPLPGPLFLNVGCGKDVRQNFVNIDLFSDDPTVVAMDVRRLDLPDSCADGVLASDILEHFSHREVDAVLAEWARVLKPGGELILRCPSLHLQAKAYLSGVWNADVASYMIFGGQTNPGDYHCIAFDEASIRRHLAAAGLTVTAFEEVDTPQERGFINLNMTVHARKSPVSRPNGAIGVVWEGSQFVTHSLALINREVCLRLAGQAGVDLSVVPFEAHQFGPETDPRFAAIAQNINRLLAGPVDVTVRHQWPPNFAPPPAGHWVMMQPWEFGSLPKNWIEVMRRQVDEVWAYTNYVRDCYIRSGMPAERVHVVPPGVAVDTFRPDAPPLALSTGKRFKFLFVGGTIGRKGIDILLKAYTAAFTAADDVCLVIKDMGGQSFYEGQTAQEMIAKMRQQPNAPEIEYIDAMLDEAQLAGLYTAADCLVHPYRGEGFGLPIAEAMACGLPVIVTGHGAALDFCTADTAYLIPAQEVRLPRKEIGGKETVDFPWWAEPDPAALQQLLRHVFTHPTEARQKAQAGMAFVRSNFTWDRTAHLVQERLQHLRGQPIVRQPAAPDPAALARVQAALAPGQALLEAGQLEEAAAELADVAARMPGEPAAHNLLGLALYRLDRLAEAEAAFQQAAAVAPGQIDAHLLLADLYRTHRAYRQAMAAVRAALEIDGENIEALVSYGLLMLDLDDLEGGEMAWERLVDAPTDHPGVSALLAALVGKGSARVGLAELLTRVEAAQAAEAWPQAAALLKGVLRHGSLAPAEAAGLWNRLGLCHFHQGQFTEAGIALARGLELAPDNLDLLGNMAQLTYQQEQFDRATEFINRALKITPDDVNILSLLGNCAVQLGALDVADMAFRRVKLLAPQTPGVDDVLAQLEALEHEPA